VLKRLLIRVAGEPAARATYAGDASPAALAEGRLAVLARKPTLRRELERRDAAIRSALATYGRDGGGPVTEVGTGLTPYLETGVLHTDIYPSPRVDLLASALALPFGDGSLAGIVGIHAFHHFSDPGTFLQECARTLTPGGLVVLIEPNFNRLSRLVFGRLHPERFEREQPHWQQDLARDNDANQALSWMVFFRDRGRVLREHPDLQFVHTRELESLSFVLTGGYLLRQLAPNVVIEGVHRFAGRGRVLGATAVHRLIVLRRR
jgi:SAM-dependent methyltransferase